ncbi:MAG: CDP-diacylglycerol--glycerol-3-phosphate 3-phosphatidyltransferase [Nitrospirae bacterium]|nr:CDP-diacylglycerol--glycerol-3-phosphate 3-phosphatidyltransferase [Nitrospirota bacterium]
MVNLPTIITVSRILLIPFFVLLVGPKPLLGASLFAFASLTDLLDGYLARRSKQVTKLGILLDPLADKLLVIAALIVLVDIGLIPAWIAIVIIAREFVVTGLRIIALSRDMIIPAELGGKIKLVTQIAAILILFVHRSFFAFDLYNIGIVLLWSAMIIGIVSGVQYFISFWRRL